MSDIQPAKSALLLMDFQNAIVGMLGEGGPALLERAGKARAAARAAGMAAMHVRVAFSDADYAAVSPRNKSFAGLPKAAGWPTAAPMPPFIRHLRPLPMKRFSQNIAWARSAPQISARAWQLAVSTRSFY